MQAPVFALIWTAASFLCGSIPFGPLFARAGRVDLSQIGSGNIGATNVWRALGWRYGLPVLLLDALKGALPVVLLEWLVREGFTPSIEQGRVLSLGMAAGFAAVLGHTFSPWLGGRGGKGVATGLGAAAALFQLWILLPIGLFAVLLALTRMVSVGSLGGALALAVMGFALPALWPSGPGMERLAALRLFGLAAAVLVWLTHIPNLKRIAAGKENRIGKRR